MADGIEKDMSPAGLHAQHNGNNGHPSPTSATAAHQRTGYNYHNPNVNLHAGDDARLPAFGGEFQPGLYKSIEGRKFANPAPLGLSAFALTTFVLSLVNLQTRGVSTPNIVVPLAFGYGGVVQLLAGMWEMAVGNTFGATALSSYGGFWISYALILTPDLGVAAAYTDAAQVPSVLGFFLIGWFIFTFVLLMCTLRSTVMFFLLFFTLDLAFLFLACAEFADNNGAAAAANGLQKTGGVFGILAAFLAWYNAFAGIADTSNSFFIIPVFHFPWSEKGREVRLQKAESHNV